MTTINPLRQIPMPACPPALVASLSSRADP